MIYLLLGILALFFGRQLLKSFARAKPEVLARMFRRSGGLASLLLGLGLLLKGQFSVALGFGGLGAWLLGLGKSPFGHFPLGSGLAGRGLGQGFKRYGSGLGGTSRVRSAMIEMELDHETGSICGTVLAGLHEGQRLDDLTLAECQTLYRRCLADDPDGARLLEAYLDRRFASWRQAGETDRDARQSRPPRPGSMSEQEAYEILGLQKGAPREEVVRSHRNLMKKMHPDHGGATDLAARVNEAKDVLMRRHQ
jgi:hypothetical protein